jgi:HD-like signal output (HDOD) protein
MNGAADLEPLVVDLIKRDAVRIPPYPAVAMKLRALVSGGKYGTSDLARLCGEDQALAATLLRYANSAQYRGVTKISSLPEAIQRIGATDVCRVALALGVAAQATSNGVLAELRRSSWRQAFMNAVVCHLLATKRGLKGEEGFLCGLLHDFGRLVALACFEEVLTQRKDMLKLTAAGWEDLVDRFHVELGLVTATRWNLPPLIVSVISSHHQPELAGSNRPMVDVVIAADGVVALTERSSLVTDSVLTPVPALFADEVPLIARLVPQLPGLVSNLDDLAPTPPGDHGPPSLVEKPITLLEGVTRALNGTVQVLRTQGTVQYRGYRLSKTGISFVGKEKLKVNNLSRLRIDAPPLPPLDLWANVVNTAPHPDGQLHEAKLFGMERQSQVAWDRIYDAST